MNHVSHINESCHRHTHRRHLPSHVWALVHIHESFYIDEWIASHILTSHITGEIFVLLMGEIFSHSWVMSHTRDRDIQNIFSASTGLYHTWLSLGTLMSESCHTYGWVTAHMIESCHTCEWVLSHVWTSHVTHTNEYCHAFDWVVTHMKESCHTYEW